jgi:hypothetical protein
VCPLIKCVCSSRAEIPDLQQKHQSAQSHSIQIPERVQSISQSGRECNLALSPKVAEIIVGTAREPSPPAKCLKHHYKVTEERQLTRYVGDEGQSPNDTPGGGVKYPMVCYIWHWCHCRSGGRRSSKAPSKCLSFNSDVSKG